MTSERPEGTRSFASLKDKAEAPRGPGVDLRSGETPPGPLRAAQGQPGACLTIVTPPLDHRLTKNGRVSRDPTTDARVKRRLAREQREAAGWAALGVLRDVGAWAATLLATYFPPGCRVRVDVALTRERGGRRWDASAVIEAAKPVLDSFTDVGIWVDDQSVVWGDITWDERPTGVAGATFTLIAEDEEGGETGCG